MMQIVYITAFDNIIFLSECRYISRLGVHKTSVGIQLAKHRRKRFCRLPCLYKLSANKRSKLILA